jgi:hypothetical protein
MGGRIYAQSLDSDVASRVWHHLKVEDRSEKRAVITLILSVTAALEQRVLGFKTAPSCSSYGVSVAFVRHQVGRSLEKSRSSPWPTYVQPVIV